MDFPEYGQQGAARPSDFSGHYNQLLFTIRQVLAKVNVASLATVTAVRSSGLDALAYVDLQVLVTGTDGYGKNLAPVNLFNVPCFRLQGGANAIIIDPAVGDVGVVVFSDRDISLAKTSQKVSGPGSRRRFDMADALYFGGMLNGTPNQYIQFTANGIVINAAASIVINAAASIVINAAEIDLSSWAGLIAPFGMGNPPAGWLLCPTTQTLVNLSIYPRLSVLGTVWGGDGVTTVGLPYFSAGYVPIQGALGALIHGQVISHAHPYWVTSPTAPSAGGGTPTWGYGYVGNTALTGGPDNLAAGMGVAYFVKY